jgi:hypothetical protein
MAHMRAVKKQKKIADRINTAFDDFERSGRITVEKAIEIGGLLRRAKSELQRGEYGPWLKADCPRLVRQAPHFMQLYDHRAEIKVDAGSSISKILRSLRSGAAGNWQKYKSCIFTSLR